MKVSEYLERVNNEIDKEGMPYFEESDLLNRIITATYSFLENNVSSIQIDQKAKEDLSLLTVPLISTLLNGVFPLSSDFYRLVSLSGIFIGKEKSIPIIQSNDLATLKDDPFHTPTINEPLCEFHGNVLEVYPIPTSIKGFYLKYPTFGKAHTDELINELPIHIQLFLIEKVVIDLMTTIGDTRLQMKYYQTTKNNPDS